MNILKLILLIVIGAGIVYFLFSFIDNVWAVILSVILIATMMYMIDRLRREY